MSDADGLIESLEQLIEKKRQIKQGAMQELLSPWEGETKDKGERKKDKTQPRKLKAGWVEKTLGEIADIRSGGTPSTAIDGYWDGNVLWCTPTDITALKGRKYISSTTRTITEEGLKHSSAELVPPNSIVMTTRATIGERAINSEWISTNQGFKKKIVFKEHDVDFLYYMLEMQISGLKLLCSGSTFLEISKKQVVSYLLHVPSLNEQTRIATILSDMDTEIATLKTKLTKAKQLKQGMMQELLTGKTRLV